MYHKGTLCIYIQNGSTFDISTMSFDGVHILSSYIITHQIIYLLIKLNSNVKKKFM